MIYAGITRAAAVIKMKLQCYHQSYTVRGEVAPRHKRVACALVYGSGGVHGPFHCSSISMQAEVLGNAVIGYRGCRPRHCL